VRNRQAQLQKHRGAPNGLLLTVEQFNRLVPVGTAVRFYPVAGEPEFQSTRTRSVAWEICGHVSVKVEGIAGGVAVSHLELEPRS
jgi:hypothetical protein